MGDKRLKTFKEYSIGAVEFINNYLGICNPGINDKTTHGAIKTFFPELASLSFDELLKNIELFYKGDVIVVQDCNNKYIPYFNPRITKDKYEETPEVEYEEEPEVLIDTTDFDTALEGMKLYELLNLKKHCIVHKKKRDYYKVLKEIKHKVDYETKEYKKEKHKIKFKELEEDYD